MPAVIVLVQVKSYPMLTPYQFSSNNPSDIKIDLDGLEGVPFWTRFGQNPAGIIMTMSWDDVWGVTDDFNRNVNPVGIGALNGYSTVTGKDLPTR